ncbi:hypothetical protein B0H17DRAFT_1211866 [Mycena rosella]|uniref:Uncharacterized protein n=1 Tax=Mycena rosella TaxID=1033263 RepID=A0AAD7G7B2_MYCRO|nr:hypothetical protein B0H17DRAFT_1211866 [Mycena rosella]
MTNLSHNSNWSFDPYTQIVMSGLSAIVNMVATVNMLEGYELHTFGDTALFTGCFIGSSLASLMVAYVSCSTARMIYARLRSSR